MPVLNARGRIYNDLFRKLPHAFAWKYIIMLTCPYVFAGKFFIATVLDHLSKLLGYFLLGRQSCDSGFNVLWWSEIIFQPKKKNNTTRTGYSLYVYCISYCSWTEGTIPRATLLLQYHPAGLLRSLHFHNTVWWNIWTLYSLDESAALSNPSSSFGLSESVISPKSDQVLWKSY